MVFYALTYATPGKRSTCTPPAYYRRISWPVPVDYLTCVNKPKIRTGIGGHFVQCEFIFLFYFLQKIGECHMLWQWIYVIQTPVSHENPMDLSRFYFCRKKNTRFENAVSWLNLPLLRNLTLLCEILSIQIKFPGIQSLFNILLVKWHALVTSYRPQSSRRTIWLVAPNLTNEYYNAIVYVLEKIEYSIVLQILCQLSADSYSFNAWLS